MGQLVCRGLRLHLLSKDNGKRASTLASYLLCGIVRKRVEMKKEESEMGGSRFARTRTASPICISLLKERLGSRSTL